MAPQGVYAQENTGEEPVEISAEKALEWDRKNHRYVARGDVEVKQGGITLYADEMTAHYDAEQGTTNLSRIDMEGNVKIVSPPYTAYGAQGTYDILTGRATLTGEGLKIVTPDEVITAKDSLEYNRLTQEFFANGQAQAVRGVYTLDADILTAKFHAVKTAEGETEQTQKLRTLHATGNVVVTAPEEKIYSDYAVYDVASDLATMTGNVRIEQGKNVLHGTKAQMDTKIGVSQLLADPKDRSDNGRVRGVFYPSEKKN